MTRQATKVQAKKVADAEACCDNFIASVNAMDADTWNCLPATTKARVAAAVDWNMIEDIRDVGPFGQALEQPQSPAPSLAPTLRVSSRVPARTCALSYSRHSCMRPLIHAYTLTRIDAYTFSRLHACTHTLILDASTLTYKHLRLTPIHIHTRWRTHTGWIALRQRENL